MEMISQTIQSLTGLEISLLFICICLIGLLWTKYGYIDALYLRVNDLQVINNRLYTMYMEETSKSLHIVDRWQKCADENKELIQKIYSSSKEQ
jgi:hypothetical protein